MPKLGVLKHFVEDFKLQFIEKTGMNKKCFFFFSLRSPCTIFR